jgi:hypothetical protein
MYLQYVEDKHGSPAGRVHFTRLKFNLLNISSARQRTMLA